ncbi:uncharacterized protein BO72DRAFT_224900 [Aspergillus fijiensis CBS 313.89]|uniref:DUF676 domain-containing protein n=1 Tax=Aspergillus fijiensis CBS 313.89 TaxID=1448319 RepID=A0A8G1VW43_9EURO|nr:uncharacterized protein BO72DRAFT_224900 [Aspergillus fijiensis CBS 313.89]RAK73816.1 hypothetical protein BO72DRAFT_224900 [Aspergillus fijiensis CBS 313.89]
MWLRDLLPQHLPAVRVMIYGYSAQVQGATQATSILEDHAETFRQRLLLFRRFEACQKHPLILIGHSLGGLVIKEFIAKIDESQRSQFSIRSVLFFGVPHHGLVHESLQTMVKGQPSSTIVDQLKPGSPTLRKLDAALCKATVLTHFSIHTFYESQETRTG